MCWLRKMLYIAAEGEFAFAKSYFQSLQKLTSKDLTQHAHRKKKVRPAWRYPARSIRRHTVLRSFRIQVRTETHSSKIRSLVPAAEFAFAASAPFRAKMVTIESIEESAGPKQESRSAKKGRPGVLKFCATPRHFSPEISNSVRRRQSGRRSSRKNCASRRAVQRGVGVS